MAKTSVKEKTVTPVTESREARFKRLARKRTETLLKRIKLLSNCSNKSCYGYDQEQIDKIFNTVHEHLEGAKQRFLVSQKTDPTFNWQ